MVACVTPALYARSDLAEIERGTSRIAELVPGRRPGKPGGRLGVEVYPALPKACFGGANLICWRDPMNSMSSVSNTVGASRGKAWLILLFCAAYVAFQVFMIVRAHYVPCKQFAFWMFPESTYFKATLTRVLADGREVITSDGAWAVQTGTGKVEYDWQDFVQSYRLDSLGRWERSKGTFDDTIKYFQAALDYVADRMPEDRVTKHLLLTIDYERAGDAVKTLVLASKARSGERQEHGPN